MSDRAKEILALTMLCAAIFLGPLFINWCGLWPTVVLVRGVKADITPLLYIFLVGIAGFVALLLLFTRKDSSLLFSGGELTLRAKSEATTPNNK